MKFKKKLRLNESLSAVSVSLNDPQLNKFHLNGLQMYWNNKSLIGVGGIKTNFSSSRSRKKNWDKKFRDKKKKNQ